MKTVITPIRFLRFQIFPRFVYLWFCLMLNRDSSVFFFFFFGIYSVHQDNRLECLGRHVNVKINKYFV